jgi:predicted hotdog family 3-hydroxylacyl-ACP dehydratase
MLPGRATRTTVRADSLHVNADGTLDPTAHLELMAQTFAAQKAGAIGSRAGRPGWGSWQVPPGWTV